jgi:hypothetical protein
MGVPASEVGYTSATTGRGNHEVHKGHVVALGKKHVLNCKNCARNNKHFKKISTEVYLEYLNMTERMMIFCGLFYSQVM